MTRRCPSTPTSAPEEAPTLASITEAAKALRRGEARGREVRGGEGRGGEASCRGPKKRKENIKVQSCHIHQHRRLHTTASRGSGPSAPEVGGSVIDHQTHFSRLSSRETHSFEDDLLDRPVSEDPLSVKGKRGLCLKEEATFHRCGLRR